MDLVTRYGEAIANIISSNIDRETKRLMEKYNFRTAEQMRSNGYDLLMVHENKRVTVKIVKVQDSAIITW